MSFFNYYFRNVFKLTNFLYTHNEAHNVIITRAKLSEKEEVLSYIRVYIWVRTSNSGKAGKWIYESHKGQTGLLSVLFVISIINVTLPIQELRSPQVSIQQH